MAGETINKAKMAEKLSKEIFAEFLWQKMDPTNLNWPCEDETSHKVKTHPSDVVFHYEEPYKQARTYVNCDLKSYGKGSITVGSIRSAIESLAHARLAARKKARSSARISCTTMFRQKFAACCSSTITTENTTRTSMGS